MEQILDSLPPGLLLLIALAAVLAAMVWKQEAVRVIMGTIMGEALRAFWRKGKGGPQAVADEGGVQPDGQQLAVDGEGNVIVPTDPGQPGGEHGGSG